jgi:predicted nucleic acid-binding protein
MPQGVVVDSGPIIGVMYEDDEHHDQAQRGFHRLAASRTRVIVPVPIVFEVYKRLAYDVGPALARSGLAYMQSSMTLVYVDDDDLDALSRTLHTMPWWGGSLEDATVAMVGLERHVPVWTFNHRDFVAFRRLQLWNLA